MPRLPHSHFSTNDFPERDRFAAWREDISVVFDAENAPVEDAEPFHATFDVYNFGHCVLAGLTASTGRYVRSTRKASRDGMDSILLQLFLEGSVQFGVGGRTTYADAGDIVVFDLAQPVDNINLKFRNLTLVWPRPLIEPVVPNISRWHGHTVPRDNPSFTLLRQHMLSSYKLAPRFTPQEGLHVAEATLALMGAAMAGDCLPETALEAPAMTKTLTYQIKRHIRENLGSADQSPEQIAHQFGISRRRLYQLLEPFGGIARYQRHLRLQRCLADLQNPAMAHQNISEIAYRWGFKHAATFNHNFRQAFGIKPSEARSPDRAGHHTFAPSPPLPRKEEHSLAEHQQWFRAIGI